MTEVAHPQLVLGIDAGGTYTDAAVVEHPRGVVTAYAKAPTTYHDLAVGVADSVWHLDRSLAGIDRVCLATTLATNTLVEGLGAGVGLLFLGFDPHVLAMSGGESRLPDCPRAFLPGAMSVRGEPAEPLDEDAIRQVLRTWGDSVGAVAVCGLFSVRNPEHELRAAEMASAELGCPAVCSHLLSGELDAVTRAATSVLNARLLPVVRRLLDAVRTALESHSMPPEVPMYLVRGDGTLMTEPLARARPLEVFFSGPAASAIGAAFLAGEPRAAVVDVGGTTSDVILLDADAVLLSPVGATIGGFRTHVPGIHGTTIGLGGDSHLRVEPDGTLRIGPTRMIPVCVAVESCGLPLESVERRLVWGWRGYPDYLIAGAPPRGRYTEKERTLLGLATGAPISLEDAARRIGLPSPILLPLQRLLSERVLLPIGPTPTDVLAAAGEIAGLDARAGTVVAQAIATALGLDIEGLAARVKDRMSHALADAVARACVSRWHPGYAWEGGADLALGSPSGNGDGSFLSVSARLGPPLVGVGAPAHKVVPGAAEKLGTRAVVPDWAEVGGAVGAAVAMVRRVATVEVRPIYEVGGATCFAVYSRRPREAYVHRERAVLRAQELARELAREDVEAEVARFGGTLEVETTSEDSTATDAWGGEIWLGTKVRAVARIATPEPEGSP